MLYAEDITDEAPYLFSELPGRFTGSYSGYNDDPLYVTVCPLRLPLINPRSLTCFAQSVYRAVMDPWA